MSQLEEILALQLRNQDISVVREFPFAADHIGIGPGIQKRLKAAGLKNWRFDFAFIDQKVAVEIQGGGWINGGHNRGKGFSSDLRKQDAALNMGWTVYSCDGAMVKDRTAINTIKKLLGLS